MGMVEGLRIAQTPTAVQRFGLLALVAFVACSNYFAYELTSITAQDLKRRMGIDNQALGVLFSLYALPNAVVPLFAGVVFDRLGVWRGLISIAVIISVGVLVIAAGVQWGSYAVFIFGRFLYGVVGESTLVGVDVLACDWFANAELGLAMGLIQGYAQLGSFAAFYGVPPLMAAVSSSGDGGASSSLPAPYWLSVGLSCLAVVLLVVARSWERRAILEASAVLMKTKGEAEEGEGLMKAQVGCKLGRGDGAEAGATQQPLASSETAAYTGDDAGEQEAMSVVDASVIQPEAECNDQEGDRCDNEGEAGDDDFLFADTASGTGAGPFKRCLRGCLSSRPSRFLGLHHLLHLPFSFFCVWASIVAYSSLFYTFLAFGPDLFVTAFGLELDRAGQVVGLVSIASALLSPLSGLLMDKMGCREPISFLCLAGAAAAFAGLGLSGRKYGLGPLVAQAQTQGAAPSYAYVPWVALAALCYSILPSSLYPLLPELVPRAAFTQTYAIVNATINAALVVAFTLAGRLSNAQPDDDDGSGGAGGNPGANYAGVFVMFVALAGIGALASGLLALRSCSSSSYCCKSRPRSPKAGDRSPGSRPGKDEREQREEEGKKAGQDGLAISTSTPPLPHSIGMGPPSATSSSSSASAASLRWRGAGLASLNLSGLSPKASPRFRPLPSHSPAAGSGSVAATSQSLPLPSPLLLPPSFHLPAAVAAPQQAPFGLQRRRFRTGSSSSSIAAEPHLLFFKPAWAEHKVTLPPSQLSHPQAQQGKLKRSLPVAIPNQGAIDRSTSAPSAAGAASSSISQAPDLSVSVAVTSPVAKSLGYSYGGAATTLPSHRPAHPSASSGGSSASNGSASASSSSSHSLSHSEAYYAGAGVGSSIGAAAGGLIIAHMAAKLKQQQQQQQQERLLARPHGSAAASAAAVIVLHDHAGASGAIDTASPAASSLRQALLSPASSSFSPLPAIAAQPPHSRAAIDYTKAHSKPPLHTSRPPALVPTLGAATGSVVPIAGVVSSSRAGGADIDSSASSGSGPYFALPS